MTVPRLQGVQHQVHDAYLNRLATHLDLVGEDPINARWILKDGLWFNRCNNGLHSLCDLIIAYDDRAVPIELKGSWAKYDKAVSQITQGWNFIDEFIHLPSTYGRVVVYTQGNYEFTRVDKSCTKNKR